MRNFVLFIFLTLTLSIDAQPFNSLDLSGKLDREALNDFVYQLDCQKSEFDINALRNSNWEKKPKSISAEQGKTYWFAVKINNPTQTGQIRNLSFGHVIYFSHIKYYLVENQKLIKSSEGGWFDTNREVNEGKISYIRLLLETKKSYTVYVRISHCTSPTIKINALIEPEEQLKSVVQSRNLFQGLFQGMLWVMLLYNFLLFTFTFNRQYLYYALYILAASAEFLFFERLSLEIFVEKQPALDTLFMIFGLNAAPIFYFLFVKRFLDLNSLSPNWIKPIQILIGVNILSFVAETTYWFATYNFYTLNLYASGKVILQAVFMLLFLIRLWRSKDVAAYYFIAGSLGLWVGVIIGGTIFLTTKMTHPLLSAQAGMISELILFSLGIAYKIRKTESEKQQAKEKLIEQLRENEELQTKVNRELEHAVKERTQEIEEQKNEIEAQAENLQTAFERISVQKAEIEYKNRSITSSIEYAQRIQQAVIPPETELKASFKDSFIFWKPRDIVSGDFLWFKSFGDKTVLIAADCTGHGVPGAFMSMLGVSLLNELARTKAMLDPADMLETLRHRIKNALNPTGHNHTTKDGMDVAAVIYNSQTKELMFSGANCPMYVISKQQLPFKVLEGRNTNLYEIKGTRNPIGFYAIERKFELHNVQLQVGDQFYIFSDGFIDQFDENMKQKFLSKRFKEFLLSISSSDMHSQKETLSAKLKEWQGEAEQIDDILVTGVRV